MSKAFTKEDDGDGVGRLDDLLHSPHPNLVTPSGLAALNTRLAARKTELTQLREQVEDIGINLAVAIAERDIRFLEERINRAILVEPPTATPDIVTFGTEVDVLDEDDTRHTFRIVGEDEADAPRGMVTHLSPVGVALLDAKVGSTVVWKRPRGNVELEVLALR